MAEAAYAFLQDWLTFSRICQLPPSPPSVSMVPKQNRYAEGMLVKLFLPPPKWTTQSWFPMIVSLCIDHPRLSPQLPDQLLPTAKTG